MFKWMRRLIWHGDRFIYFISGPVGSWIYSWREQLKNVQAGSLLIELAQNAVSNGYSTEGSPTELSLNSGTIKSGRKQVVALDNSDYQKMALGMDGNDLRQSSCFIGPVDNIKI